MIYTVYRSQFTSACIKMKSFLLLLSVFTPAFCECDIPGIYVKNKADLISVTPSSPVTLVSKSDPLPVYCTAKDANRIHFRINGIPVNDTKINRTSIVTYFYPDDPGKTSIECLLENENKGNCVLEVYVYIGINDFNCVSQNLESFDCFWNQIPKYNIDTKYSLEYFVDKNQAIQTCCGGGPSLLSNSDNFKCSFKDCSFLSPFPCCQNYHEDILIHNVIHFELLASINVTSFVGALGNHSYYERTITRSWKYNYEHDSLVRPKAPENLQILYLNSTEPQVFFDVSNKLKDFIKWQPLEYKIDIYCKENCSSHQSGTIAQFGQTRVILSDLRPWTEYTIRVKLRVHAAKDKRYWSEYAEMKTRTPPRPPAEPPKIDPASFQILKYSDSGATIRLHWKPVQEVDYNGPGFGYQILTSSAKEALTHQVHNASSVDLTNVSIGTNILVFSENEEGRSEPSQLFVPDWESVKDIAPNYVENIFFGKKTETVISWSAPFNADVVDNYTLFWCLEPLTKGCPYRCDGQLDWKTVLLEKDQYQYNLSISGHIGVAANRRDFSSGVVWPTWEKCPTRVPWFMSYPWIVLVPLTVVLMGIVFAFACCKTIQWYRKKLAFFDKLGGDMGHFVIPGIEQGKAFGTKIKDDLVTKQTNLVVLSQTLESSLISFGDDCKPALHQKIPLSSDVLLPSQYSDNLSDLSSLATLGETLEDPGYSKFINKVVLTDGQMEPTMDKSDASYDRSRVDSYISVEEATNFKEVTMALTEDNYISVGSISRNMSLSVPSDQSIDNYITIGSVSRKTSINVTSDQQRDAYITVGSISRLSSSDVTSELPKSEPSIQNGFILPKTSTEDCTSIICDQNGRLSEDSMQLCSKENAKNDPYTSINSILQMNTHISSMQLKDNTVELPNNMLHPTLKHPEKESYFSKDITKIKSNDEGYIKIYSISRQSSLDNKLPNMERESHHFGNNYILPETLLECPKFVDGENMDKCEISKSLPHCSEHLKNNNGYSKIVSALIQTGELSQPGYSKVGLGLQSELGVS